MKLFNIYIIGFRCCGKTTIGKIIAQRLSMNFADTDQMIEEKLKMSIKDIVKEFSWKRFREEEKKIIKKISQLKGYVVATGGGAVIDPENTRLMKKSGFAIWLKVSWKQAVKRRFADKKDRGPALTDLPPIEEIKLLISQRDNLYQQASMFYFNTDNADVEKLADHIIKTVDLSDKSLQNLNS